ncbi:TMEM175 family protein [Catellatospora sp. KI3]|uniref:TMEM175 family protein n=1 Tax=Catellatospora sp. KI3 TaxID=3041620 RepID=UPI0024821E08|nr:TMEM175 family protein [Catellatospora sp. KI3]MDI1461220.1 TMEM175 family protein [Catellatospora sp. KI3]
MINFSDGLFAIAMTLLVVEVGVPKLLHENDVRELADDLADLIPNFVGFFLSFAVIGRYWVAHHQMFSLLRGVDTGLIVRNLVYLAFVAFLPFPTALLGDYFGNPLAVTVYAAVAAVVSGLEVVLLRHAYRAGLLRVRIGPDVLRWGTVASVSPVVLFALSIPVAYWNTTAAVAVWFLSVPFGIFMDRHRPEGAELLQG